MGERLLILCLGTLEDARLIRRWLRESPYKGSRTYHAINIASASLTRNYDIIISNLSDGVETLLLLTQAYPGIPILYLGDNPQLAERAIALGAQDYLPILGEDNPLLKPTLLFARKRESLTQKLRAKIFTDELTGLYNRRGFMTLLEQQMHQTKRSNQGFMLFLFDLDYFKQINDKHGHLVGDQALIKTAQCLCNAFRAHDIIARLGGDEFAVLALNSRPESEALLKRHLTLRLEELNADPHQPYTLSFSIGSVYYNGNGTPIQELIDKADKDLYKHKKLRHHFALGREDKI